VTKDGRIATLTNFREETAAFEGATSRGEMVNAYLTQPAGEAPDTALFVRRLVEGDAAKGAGGFSLVCGRIGEPLAIISNRTPSVSGVAWVASGPGETVGLSNAAFADHSWPKVVQGERLMADAIGACVARRCGQAELAERLMEVLGTDTLPRPGPGERPEVYLRQLRNSIFIPVIGGSDASHDGVASANGGTSQIGDPATGGAYGTRQQSVLLVDQRGNVTLVERSLFDGSEGSRSDGIKDRVFEFAIEGWKRR
jgi:uncharacterized protein with NRDE domain